MPDFNTQLEEIQNNRPELVALKSVVTELHNVQEELGKGSTAQTEAAKEQVATLKTLESALKELLNKPEKELDVSTVVSELKSLSEGLKSVQKAVQSIDVKPHVTVDAPTVNVPAPKVTIPKIDLSKLEKLITSLPEAISQLIPESPEPDLSTLTEGLDALKSVMEDVRDRPIPIPQMGTIKVTNPDGSTIAGGGGGGALNTSAKGATAAGNPTSTAASADRQPLDVTLRDTSGAPVAVGGGTQYADGAARGTATGTIAMGDDGTNIQSIKTDSSGVLAIQDNGGSITVDGTFFQATQPVSAATLPLPTGAATSAIQTDKSQFTKITDGTDTALVTAAGEQNTIDTNLTSAFRASALADGLGSTNSLKVHSHTYVYNGATYDRVTGDAANGMDVDVTRLPSLVAGTALVGKVSIDQVTANANEVVTKTGSTTAVTGTVTTKETRAATPAQTSVSITTASTSILASNANRLGFTVYNEGTAICYMKLGATASLTSYTVQIASGGYYECPFAYTGAVDGITSASTAQLRISELT